MPERVHGPVQVSALRVGRTDVGAATALMDDDALTLVVRVESEERSLRFATIDSVRRAGDDLELIVRDGTRVSLSAPPESSLADDLLGRCRSIPELTRTLRAFGSRRPRPGARTTGRDSDAGEQQRFFA